MENMKLQKGMLKNINILSIPIKNFKIIPSMEYQSKRGSPMHVAPGCVGSDEGPGHFGFYAHSLSLYFCKTLFPGIEPMTSWSQGNNFTAAPGLPISWSTKVQKKITTAQPL
jgi:hypothetical protein